MFGLLIVAVVALLLFLFDDFLQSRNKSSKKIQRMNPFSNVSQKKSKSNPVESQKEINLLAIAVGFIIALSVNANLYNLLAENGKLSSVISSISEINLTNLIGYLITGFFLSFGSKFFHDLLETVFQVKNMKQKLYEKETYQFDNVKQLNEWVALSPSEMIQSFITQNKNLLLKQQGVHGISMGMIPISNGKEELGVIINTSLPDKLNTSLLTCTLPNGIEKQLPFKINKTEIAKAHGLKAPLEISNANSQTNTGTLCCSMKRGNETLLLTCYHVAKDESHKWENIVPSEYKVLLENKGDNYIGEITKTCFDDYFDIALIKPDEGVVFKNHFDSIHINKIRQIYTYEKVTVNVLGAKTNKVKTGIVDSLYVHQTINYGDGCNFVKSDLIGITNNNMALTQAGDSGAIVYTNDGEAIGMIIAGNETHSFAIPMYEICKRFNLKI
jgi:V8-like Glu-specific endopeptidase